MIKKIGKKIKQNHRYRSRRILKRHIEDVKTVIPFYLYKKHMKRAVAK